MKKQLFKNGIVSLVLCFALLFSGTTIYADVPEETQMEDVNQNGEMVTKEDTNAIQELVQDNDSTETVEHSTESLEAIPEDVVTTEENAAVEVPEESTEVTEPTEDNITEEPISTDGISIIGLEGISIKEITDIELSKVRSSCNGLHTWETVSVIQEGNCELEWIYKIRCTACGATATAYTDAPGHNYVDGVCTVCGGIEVAPDEELKKWEYTLNDTDGTITLKKYISDMPDVIVYGAYKVDGKVYSVVLNGGIYRITPFYDKRKNLKSIKIKNGVKSYNCSYLFNGCNNLKMLDLSNFDTSQVVDMQYMFFGCSGLTSLELSSFDTSQVTSMRAMFKECSSLVSINLSSFDASKVTSMQYMFYDCKNLQTVNLKKIITTNVKNYDGMFYFCSNLKIINLTSFKTTNAISMKFMFGYSTNLTDIYVDENNWDTSNADTTDMFKNCGTQTVTKI